jgi:tripartite-type tricarboxylate transporter receptor subunit TctC
MQHIPLHSVAIQSPYKGASPALQDLLGGQVASTVGVLGIALPHIQAGDLRALAMTGATRSSFLPDVPTLTETGYPGLEIAEWQGLFVPAKTPPAIVQALNRSVRDALDTAEVKSGLVKLSFEAGGTSPEEFAHEIGPRALGADRESVRVHAGELSAARFT